jgi:hypothetical protein
MTVEFKKLKAGMTIETPDVHRFGFASLRRYTLLSDPRPGRLADSAWSAAIEGGGSLHWDPYGKMKVLSSTKEG